MRGPGVDAAIHGIRDGSRIQGRIRCSQIAPSLSASDI
jgi:hypothetical protein